MTCIITGCAATNGHERVGGDLHMIGGSYVFNATRDKFGEVAWGDTHYTKQVDFSKARHIFEKHGVIVAPVSQCELNQEAADYVRTWA